MDISTVQKIITLLSGLPVSNVILIGGEPTIHPNFLAIVAMIKASGFNPLLVTNGIRFKEEDFLDQALNSGLAGINTSFKAPNGIQYKRLTGKNAFSDVMTAIGNIERKRIKANISHRVSLTMCEYIFPIFDETISAIKDSGASILLLDTERPVIINGKISSPKRATPKEVADFLVEKYPIMEKCGMEFYIRLSLPFCLFPEWFIEELVKKNRIISGCQLMYGNGIIFDQRGRILPCNYFCDNPLGEIGSDIVNSQDYVEFREREDIATFYRKVTGCPHQKCVECDQWRFCGGGCRIYWFQRKYDELIGNFKPGHGPRKECQ
jgi:radical SAM protein with 4Fe4S-binding SPASM domain